MQKRSPTEKVKKGLKIKILSRLHLDPRKGLRPILADNFEGGSVGLVGADKTSLWRLFVSRLPAIFISIRFQFRWNFIIVLHLPSFCRAFNLSERVGELNFAKLIHSFSRRNVISINIQIEPNEVRTKNRSWERSARRIAQRAKEAEILKKMWRDIRQ